MRSAWAAVLLLGWAPMGWAAPDWAGCRNITDDVRRLACYDAATATATPQKADAFGKDKKESADTLTSRLRGPFGSWNKGTEFALENGQVWVASESGEGYYPGIPDHPAVTIERSYFGAYWLTVEGAHVRIKVRRLR